MKQCKLCGIPLGNEPTTEELESHWFVAHEWHFEEHQNLTAEEAIIKNRGNT